MASEPRTRSNLENKRLEDPHPDCDCQHHQPRAAPRIPSSNLSVLSELVVNRIQGVADNSSLVDADSSAFDLDDFHNHHPAKENLTEAVGKTRTLQIRRRRLASPAIRAEDQRSLPHATSVQLPELPTGSRAEASLDFEHLSIVDIASQNLPSTPEQVAKLQAATPLEGDESSVVVSSVAQESDNMSSTTEVHTHVDTTVIHVTGTHGGKLASQPRTSELILLGKNDDIVEQIISLPPAQPASRIEDSVEALDKLEEELEALDDVTVLRGLSLQETKTTTLPSGKKSTDASTGSTLKRAGSTSKKPTGQVASSTPDGKTVGRASSVRRPVSMIAGAEGDSQPGTAKTAPRRSAVARPTSLLPPKPPAKSTKPPTLPTFELPGESVARRLKEQREARRSQQVSSEEAAALADYFSPAKPHFKSSKPPTRPTFELPGEAISRRKREEREAKLRAEEEEERKRREFKARPIRSSAVPSSYPRETVASRARQSKMLQPEASPEAPSPNKRHSIAVASMTRATGSPAKAGPLQASSAVTRGRASLPGSPSTAQMSRTTSTSTSSMHGSTSGQRSTVSSDDAAQQRLRGKEIYSRDNGLTAGRVRERRDREETAKTARQYAAERSRQLSREWAEKQRARAVAVGVTATGSSGRSS